MNQSERRLYLIKSLLKEEPSYRGTQIPQGTEKQETPPTGASQCTAAPPGG